MSSYQQQGTLGNFLTDYLPDYLTCGYCAREFPLDNITLFIAHKMGGCDKSCHSRALNLPHVEDTSAPLTCSYCARVFMTARGLLHHVQEDHQMVLCLQKGPLFLTSNNAVRPPPAHSTVSGVEVTSTNCFSHTSTNSSLPRVQTDQPTDLSMTCSNSLGKARVKCSEEKCEITIEPISNLNSNQVTGTAVPKKRKFLFQQNNDINGSTDWETTHNDYNGNSSFNNEDKDKDNRDSSVFRLDQTTDSTVADKGLAICVKAEYQRDTLCSVSLSTEKKDRERHSKLKRLLQQDTPTSEKAEISVQSSDANATTVIYKVPFLAPQDLDSATLKASFDEAQRKTLAVDNREFSYRESSSKVQAKSPTTMTDVNIPKLIQEKSIDQVVKSASEIFPEDFEILSLYPIPPSLPSKHLRDSESNLSFSPRSPRLMMPDENYQSHNLFNISHSDMGKNINSMTSSWRATSGADDQSQQPLSVTTSMSSPILSAKISNEANSGKQTEFLRNSLNLVQTLESNPSITESVVTYISNDIICSRDNSDEVSIKNMYPKGPFSGGEHVMSAFKQHNKKPTNEAGISIPPAPALGDQAYNTMSGRMWLNVQNENTVPTVPFSVAVHTPTMSSTSDHFDVADHDSLDVVCMDSDDVSSVDGKATKKRRYPTSRPFKCTSCEQAFNQRIHLKKHMSKHTGVKPFKCQQCDYSTVERSHLKVHYRIHTGEKPYRCMFCDYATAQNSTLKIHLKRHHEGQATSELSRLRDNSQASCSLDDDEWNLQDSFFINIQSNSQSNGKDITRCSSALDGSGVHAFPIEGNTQVDGRKSVDTCKNIDHTGHIPDPSVPSLLQIKGESSISVSERRLYLQGERSKYNNFNDHHGNGDEYKIKAGLKTMKENENTSPEMAAGISQRKGRFNCKEAAPLFTDVASSIKLQSPSIFDVGALGVDKTRSKETKPCRSPVSKSKQISNLFTKSQASKLSFRSTEIAKWNPQDVEASQCISSEILHAPQQKTLIKLIREELLADSSSAQKTFEKEEMHASGKTELMGAAVDLHEAKLIRTLPSVQNIDDLDTSPVLTGVTVSVAIPDKEFVRG